MYGQAHIPKQRIPLTQKDEKWRKDCVDAFINLSKFCTEALIVSEVLVTTSEKALLEAKTASAALLAERIVPIIIP